MEKKTGAIKFVFGGAKTLENRDPYRASLLATIDECKAKYPQGTDPVKNIPVDIAWRSLEELKMCTNMIGYWEMYRVQAEVNNAWSAMKNREEKSFVASDWTPPIIFDDPKTDLPEIDLT